MQNEHAPFDNVLDRCLSPCMLTQKKNHFSSLDIPAARSKEGFEALNPARRLSKKGRF